MVVAALLLWCWCVESLVADALQLSPQLLASRVFAALVAATLLLWCWCVASLVFAALVAAALPLWCWRVASLAFAAGLGCSRCWCVALLVFAAALLLWCWRVALLVFGAAMLLWCWRVALLVFAAAMPLDWEARRLCCGFGSVDALGGGTVAWGAAAVAVLAVAALRAA